MAVFSMILSLLSGVALFLFGMSLMGDGLKLVAGNKLEAFLNEMEQVELTLDKSFKKYKECMELLNKCNTMLDKVEKQIVIIDDNGVVDNNE